MEFLEFRVRKDPECPLCGERPTLTALIDYEGFCGVPAVEAPGFAEISAASLHARRAHGEPLLLLDVREAHEVERARIEGATWIPLGELSRRVGELEPWRERPVVVHCHHGGRSAKACALLAQHGFHRLENLVGGIDAWSLSVDAGVPRY
jgi:adenylyltransferase/sulfurtransferase